MLARDSESGLCELRDPVHVIRGANYIDHRGGGNFESSRTNGEGEGGTELVFVLRGLAHFGGVVAQALRSEV